MNNDDLTPEEREALANLPRERMPSAGLEDRVVVAMRERGHLSRKPARVIRLTTTRVAGLLAACVVLMIGAYSIGLHRGVDDEVLRRVEPQGNVQLHRETDSDVPTNKANDDRVPPVSEEKGQIMSVPEATNPVTNEKIAAPPLEWNLNTPQLAARKDTKKEKQNKPDEVNEAMTRSFSDRLSSEGVQPAPATDLAAPSSPPMPAQLRAQAMEGGSVSRARTFTLNGGTLIVDAPDSVRVVTDEQGRTLLIYTSDGVIRIRLAD
jgi:hypothetical protein